jgi:hypothetical protein
MHPALEAASHHLVSPLVDDPPQLQDASESAPPPPGQTSEAVAYQANPGGSDNSETGNSPSSATITQPLLGALGPEVADPAAANAPETLHVALEGGQERSSLPRTSPDRLEAQPADCKAPGEAATRSELREHIPAAAPEQGDQEPATAHPGGQLSEGISPAGNAAANAVVEPPKATQQPSREPAAGWSGGAAGVDDAHLHREGAVQPPTSAVAPEAVEGSHADASPTPPPTEGPPPTAANVVEAIANLAAAYGPGGQLPADLAAYLPPGYGHLMTHPAMAQAVHQGGYAPFGQYQGGAVAGVGGAMGMGSSQLQPGAVDSEHSSEAGRKSHLSPTIFL